MSAPDYRIKFPSTLIDFPNDIGTTGQDHDNYPSPGTQARYDWLRLYLIGLLSNQASANSPTNYREGSLWVDTSNETLGPILKIYRNHAWTTIADVIELGGVTLTQWHAFANDVLASSAPELYFAGTVASDSIAEIAIPVALRSKIYTDTRAFVTINGANTAVNEVANQNIAGIIKYRPLMLDPRNIDIIGGSTLRLYVYYQGTRTQLELLKGETYAVSLRRIPATTFLADDQPI
jgi:hypothetical protein